MKSKIKLLMFSLILVNLANAQTDGTLDATFNSTGKFTTIIITSRACMGYDVAVQTDGKIIVVGYTMNSANTFADFAMIRLTTTGSLDATFGTGGIVTTDFQGDDDVAYGVAIDSDGKIIVVGYSVNGTTFARNIVIARYTASGVLDNTFGSGGKIIGTNTFAEAHDVAIQSDGKIVVAGWATGSSYDITLIRLTSAGAYDNTFGTSGVVVKDLESSNRLDKAFGLRIQSNGKIIVVGCARDASSNDRIAIARFNSDGNSLDTDFNSTGMVINTSISSAIGLDLAVQSDGSVVVIAQTTSVIVVLRYSSTGSLDTGFGTSGKITTTMNGDATYGFGECVIDANGNILVTGSISSDFGVARYNSSGTLDALFGNSGVAQSDLGSGDRPCGLAISSTGSIVAAGYSGYSFAVAKYVGSYAPLPVELISFSAHTSDNSVSLIWQTATEVNNYGFEIERAIVNGELRIANWEKIGFVQGHGNNNSPQKYFFNDVNPIRGKAQYRLKQIDFDGAFEYSGIVEVVILAPNIFALHQNYPNPFNPTTIINYQIPQDGFVTIKVYDLIGKEIITLVNENKSAGYYKINFDAGSIRGGLTSGVYIYTIRANNYIQSKKMLLMK